MLKLSQNVKSFRHAGHFFGLIFCVWALLTAYAARGGDNPFQSPGQSVYRHSVPHTDHNGKTRFAYDRETSFFPIGIYHALNGRHHGASYDLSVVTEAGFNTVMPWEGQSLASLTNAADAYGLRIIFHNPSNQDILAGRQGGPVLAWYLNEEPTLRVGKNDFAKQFQLFTNRLTEIRTLDPGRATLVIDSPHTGWPHWPAWNSRADVSAHWNYPFYDRTRNVSIEPVSSIKESVAMAVQLNKERKPVWLVVQAFASPLGPWRMPEATEVRATVFTGIVNGATGIIYFAFDSFVTRDGDVIGVAPSPRPDYGPAPDYNNDGKPPLAATQAQVEQSRSLWLEIGNLNRILNKVAPYLLSLTSSIPFKIIADEPGFPIQAILKTGNQDNLLIAVNTAAAPVNAQFQFEAPVAIAPFERLRPYVELANEDVFPFAPREVKLFRLRQETGR